MKKNVRILRILFGLFFKVVIAIGQTQEQQPLNVIWISTEDMGPILSAYGTEAIKTPNIDRLGVFMASVP